MADNIQDVTAVSAAADADVVTGEEDEAVLVAVEADIDTMGEVFEAADEDKEEADKDINKTNKTTMDLALPQIYSTNSRDNNENSTYKRGNNTVHK